MNMCPKDYLTEIKFCLSVIDRINYVLAKYCNGESYLSPPSTFEVFHNTNEM